MKSRNNLYSLTGVQVLVCWMHLEIYSLMHCGTNDTIIKLLSESCHKNEHLCRSASDHTTASLTTHLRRYMVHFITSCYFNVMKYPDL